MRELQTDAIESPIGTLQLVADGDCLCTLDFSDDEERMMRLLTTRYGPFRARHEAGLAGITDKLRRYLAGDVHCIDDIAVETGGTEFQRKVWAALRTIPVGSAISYAELAIRIGQPTAVRAVGHANSLNPVAIVVPCHRVVGSSAALTGYAGGIERKAWLLRHERADLESLAARHRSRDGAPAHAQERLTFL